MGDEMKQAMRVEAGHVVFQCGSRTAVCLRCPTVERVMLAAIQRKEEIARTLYGDRPMRSVTRPLVPIMFLTTTLLAACGGGGNGGDGGGGGGGMTVTTQRVFPSLSFSQPVAMLQAPGDNARWFV